MFYEAVERGLKSDETNISHNEALKVISGGLIQFLCDFKYTGNIRKCEKQLFCIAKATNALQGEIKEKYITLLGLLAAMDPYSRDCRFISDKIAETIGVNPDELERTVDIIKSIYISDVDCSDIINNS